MWAVQWFRIGLSIFLILSVVLGTLGCSTQAATPWQPATSILPKEVLLEIVKQQSAGVPEPEAVIEKTMRAWVMEGREGEVVVFDFNTPEWCGTGGCYYSVYWVKDRNAPPHVLMTELFYPQLPNGKAFFQVGEDNGQPIPCLKVWQPENVEMTQLRQTNYCCNGQQYLPVSSQVFDQPRSATSEK